jgi:hypothetical protein
VLLVLIAVGVLVLMVEVAMTVRIWKRVGHDMHGYGNGFKAVVYEFPFTDQVQVRILKGDNEVTRHDAENLNAGKRWAERHYLKGKK